MTLWVLRVKCVADLSRELFRRLSHLLVVNVSTFLPYLIIVGGSERTLISRAISLQLAIDSDFAIVWLSVNITRPWLLIDEAYHTRVHVHVLVEAFAVVWAILGSLAPLGLVHCSSGIFLALGSVRVSTLCLYARGRLRELLLTSRLSGRLRPHPALFLVHDLFNLHV